MKKWIFVFLMCGVLPRGFPQDISFPKYKDQPVNDFARVISTSYEERIDGLAREVIQKTGVALVVVTVENMGGMAVDDYANRLYEAWGIGQRGKDEGALFLLAVEERKVRIEVGYGLEGILPDGVCGDILDRYALPDFRDGNYGGGFYRSMAAVAGIIAKDRGAEITGAVAPRTRTESSEKGGIGGIFFVLFFIFLMIVTKGRILPWLFLSMMMGGGGRGGGFSGRGGGFGGGFGGFGGGMSGGGGASRGF